MNHLVDGAWPDNAVAWRSPHAPPTGTALPTLRMVYIEDNPVNVMLMQEFVAMRANVSLRCATNGSAGVALARQLRPDVALIDMQLPDFDGFEVLRRLRADPVLQGMRCIALSANAIPDDVARAGRAGFDDYWTKPIDLARFLRGLDTLAHELGRV